MKRWLLGVALVVIVVGIRIVSINNNDDSSTVKPVDDPAFAPNPKSHTASSPSWAFYFVRWNDRTYVITETPVPKQRVGKQLGAVTSSSDREGEYTGTFSNYYPIGTKLFAIQEIDPTKAIAVQIGQDEYREATVQQLK
ncbi:MAG: hypothetical protein ACXVP5_08005 [Tumebacillaceae bacterium]